MNVSEQIERASERLALQPPDAPRPVARRASLGSAISRIALHTAFLVIALGCLAGYAHFQAHGQSTASLASLAAAALFGFAPLRDIVHLVFGVEGKVLHVVHALGGVGLAALPLSGAVHSTPLLTHAATAPFAIMGAAQAVMHQNHPRSAKQAAALQRFAASLPEIAQFAGAKDFASPENARRAVVALSDIIAKAQALGETELEADPDYQSALHRVSTRAGASLGLDAVDLTLAKLAANPATAAAVPQLRARLASARKAIAAGERR